uniref:Uncharacterized protein n=1 Tax=Cucumis melo TaxID=3656 RepID=A0A9I9EEI9_CUCME
MVGIEPEEIWVGKEVRMKKEIKSKNKEYELLQSKYKFLRLDNLTHDSMVDEDKIKVNQGVEGDGE